MLTTLLLIAVFITAGANWLAVARGWKKAETIAKPVTMVLLFGWLALAGGFGAAPLICFGLGIFFSLAGDVFLMLSDRWFVSGLVAFLLAHGTYIVGFNLPLPEVPLVWSLGIAVVLALTAGRILRRILDGVRAKGLPRLVVPVVAYGMVITLMLLSAVLTIFRLDWKPSAAGLVSLGAVLFYLSDILLAWNKFVKPIRNGRVMNMVAYHLGQIGLIVGVVIQFAR